MLSIGGWWCFAVEVGYKTIDQLLYGMDGCAFAAAAAVL